tara:strand:+ start:119 stop:988 length:870 start_codon:yes stop_codon:yes gene_type:complete
MNINRNILHLIKKKLYKEKNYYNFFSKKFDKKNSIRLSYDYQSGNYIKRWLKNKSIDYMHDKEVVKIIKENFTKFNSILDCGCGELTRTQNIIKLLDKNIKYYAFDISLNRLLIGLKKFKLKKKINAFVADIENLPFFNRSIDVCLTIHSIEPNSGMEKEFLEEILRVSNLGAVLIEPDFILGSKRQKARMKKLNYCKNLEKIIKKQKYRYKKIPLKNILNIENKSSAFVIFKKKGKKNVLKYVDPCFKKELKKNNYSYFSKYSDVIYPILANIPIFDISKSFFMPKKK